MPTTNCSTYSARAHAAPVFKPAPRATLPTKVLALGRHVPEARRGAARQSLHSVLYSSPVWSPEQSNLNPIHAGMPREPTIHPRFAQAPAAARRSCGGMAAESAAQNPAAVSQHLRCCARAMGKHFTVRLACRLSAPSASPRATTRSRGRRSRAARRSAGSRGARCARRLTR